MTTNHPELLDPALVRPGQISKKLHLSYMSIQQMEKMIAFYFSTTLTSEQRTRLEVLRGSSQKFSPADIEEICAENFSVADAVDQDSEERVNPFGGLIGTSGIKAFFRREYNNIAPHVVSRTKRFADYIVNAIRRRIDAIKAKLGMPVSTKMTEADAFRRSAKGHDDSMLQQVKVWVNDKKSIDFAKKELRIEKLAGEALKNSPNFKYYDDFMSRTATEWARDLTSIDDAKKLLGMEKLSADALKVHANYKYYDKFMDSSVVMWVGGGKSIDDAKNLLGLETLSAAAFKASDNFKYYDKFMTMRVEAWLRSGKSLDDVKTLLGFNTLNGELRPTGYLTYDEYMTIEVAKMVKSGISLDAAKKELGLNKLTGEALKNHINSKYLDDFIALKKAEAK
ncbi:hypothetical protein PHYBOEH_002740 [Phytophthora boehmeriae]|uniref:Uncharacterized protein n=1 Tax=Phytophthora boehmeriae TaxID=109152 RepID=A0A8T1WRS2_9STRA|nr:hypothetical protein PHYBOEH_002740 [Phytophthora boehmeriae]